MSSLRSRSGMRTPRRTRQTRSTAPVVEIDDDVTEEPCIDLTSPSPDYFIDLTRNQSVIDDSPSVVLTQWPSDEAGPVRRRRGSGRRGSRRIMSTSRPFAPRISSSSDAASSSTSSSSSSSSNVDPALQVHVLVWDNSDGEELPEVPFQIPSSSSAANSSIVSSPEGIKISCPVCMDDVKQIKKSRRQVMSTICGHIFCDECIRTAISSQHACPTCRKLLNVRNIHPIFL